MRARTSHRRVRVLRQAGRRFRTARDRFRNYERMKELVDRWIELSMELSNLRLARPKA
jgi:hypothetical protein